MRNSALVLLLAGVLALWCAGCGSHPAPSPTPAPTAGTTSGGAPAPAPGAEGPGTDLRELNQARGLAVTMNLNSDPELATFHLSVKAQGGKATLSGQVQTPQQRDRAQQLAFRAKGITEVENLITVAGSPGTP